MGAMGFTGMLAYCHIYISYAITMPLECNILLIQECTKLIMMSTHAVWSCFREHVGLTGFTGYTGATGITGVTGQSGLSPALDNLLNDCSAM